MGDPLPHIDLYFVAISPWTYLAMPRFREIAARHGADVTYKPADYGRVFKATGGLQLNERSEARKEYRLQELRRARIRTGLPLTTHPAHFPTNPAPASYAIIAAQAAGGGDTGALVEGLLAACWAEERNIADDDVIRACLEQAGFDPGLADSGLLSGATTYEANTEEAIQVGAFGAPFFIVDGEEKFWGQDRLEDLDLFLQGKL